MTQKTLYCNMLVLNEALTHALVLTKLHGPAFLLGKDNFPGGHIEPGETPKQGAIRETEEEADVQIGNSPVVLLNHMTNEKSELFTYATAVPQQVFESFKSMTDEPLRIEEIKPYLAALVLNPEKAAPDLLVLIPKGVELLAQEMALKQTPTPSV